MSDEIKRLAFQRARRRCKPGGSAERLAERIESDWRARRQGWEAELAEERALESGSAAAGRAGASRREREQRAERLRVPHRFECRCDREIASGCPELAEIAAGDRQAVLGAREWLHPSDWATAMGSPPVSRADSDRAIAIAESRILSGMAFIFEIHGDLAWQFFPVVDRLRQLYAEAISGGSR